MRFNITFKTPDAIEHALEEVGENFDHHDFFTEDDPDEAMALAIEEAEDDCREFLSKFIQYGETITIEFDSFSGTATVKRIKE